MRNSAYSILAILAVSALMASPIQAQSRRGSEGHGSSAGRGGASSSYSQPRQSHQGSGFTGGRGGADRRSSGPSTVTSKGLGGVSSMNRGQQSYDRGQQRQGGQQNYDRNRQGYGQSRPDYDRSRQNTGRAGNSDRQSFRSGGTDRNRQDYNRGQQRPNSQQSYSRGPQSSGRPAQGNHAGSAVRSGHRAEGGYVSNGAGGQYRVGRPAPGNVVGAREPGRVHMAPGPGRDVVRVHPHARDAIRYDMGVRFWDHGHHYFGYRVIAPPPHICLMHYWGRPYYFCDDIWYRFHDGCYSFCRPPFGVSFVPAVLHTCLFAFYCDAYRAFDTINENANTIVAQNATIAANNAIIAQQNENIALNTGKANRSYALANNLGLVQSYADASVEYYYEDGVFFTKNADGKYTVIVPPAGALVQDLPDDYETVSMNGVEYYKVDDTIYRMTIVDGSAYFEVLGQLTGEAADRFELSN